MILFKIIFCWKIYKNKFFLIYFLNFDINISKLKKKPKKLIYFQAKYNLEKYIKAEAEVMPTTLFILENYIF